jgi:hypothetical protein
VPREAVANLDDLRLEHHSEESFYPRFREDLLEATREVVIRVDVNPTAVELSKINLWLEAVIPGKPLSFQDHRIQCGISLLGTTPALVAKGIPDEAFKPTEGDDKEVCRELKKRNRTGRKGQQTLRYVEEPDFSSVVRDAKALRDAEDDTLDKVEEKRRRYEELMRRGVYRRARHVADAWCAAFVWRKDRKRRPVGMARDLLRRSEDGRRASEALGMEPASGQEDGAATDAGLVKEIRRLAERYRFFQWHLAFPEVFAPKENPGDGVTGWSGRFDVVLGNPPWERIRLQEREFFASRCPWIPAAPNTVERRRRIEQLRTKDPALWHEFQEAKRRAEGESHAGPFVRPAPPLLGPGGGGGSPAEWEVGQGVAVGVAGHLPEHRRTHGHRECVAEGGGGTHVPVDAHPDPATRTRPMPVGQSFSLRLRLPRKTEGWWNPSNVWIPEPASRS